MGALRLFLATCIVFGHAGAGFIPGDTPVQSFYAISGFYMGLVLNEKYRPGLTGTVLFWGNRYLRLLPIYAAVLGLTLLLATLGHHLARELVFVKEWRTQSPDGVEEILLVASILTMLGQDVWMFLPGMRWQALPVPQAWTLGVELWFYLLVPLFARRSIRTLLLVMAASVACRMTLQFTLGASGDPWSYRFFPSELAVFCIGILAYHTYRSGFDRSLVRLLVVTSVGMGLVLVLNRWNGIGRAASVAALVLALIAIPYLFERFARSRIDRHLGELSYPIYVSHLAVIWSLQWLGFGGLPLIAWSVLLTGLLSSLLYLAVERPIEAWRQAWTAKAQPPADRRPGELSFAGPSPQSRGSS